MGLLLWEGFQPLASLGNDDSEVEDAFRAKQQSRWSSHSAKRHFTYFVWMNLDHRITPSQFPPLAHAVRSWLFVPTIGWAMISSNDQWSRLHFSYKVTPKQVFFITCSEKPTRICQKFFQNLQFLSFLKLSLESHRQTPSLSDFSSRHLSSEFLVSFSSKFSLYFSAFIEFVGFMYFLHGKLVWDR